MASPPSTGSVAVNCTPLTFCRPSAAAQVLAAASTMLACVPGVSGSRSEPSTSNSTLMVVVASSTEASMTS